MPGARIVDVAHLFYPGFRLAIPENIIVMEFTGLKGVYGIVKSHEADEREEENRIKEGGEITERGDLKNIVKTKRERYVGFTKSRKDNFSEIR